MFLSRLDKAQRRSFLALVTKMAMADGKVAPEETQILNDIGHMLGQTAAVPADEIFGETNIEPFDSEQSRIITVLGMLMVAYSDKNFHVDESSVLVETVNSFGIGPEKFYELKTLAENQANLYHDIREIIG